MKQEFALIPPSGSAQWLLIPASILVLGALVLLVYLTFYSSGQHVTIELSSEGLRIRGDLYGRLIPLTTLRVDEAKSIDLSQERDYQLKWRTNGIGLPGYSSGWFRLRNGGKGLVFVTDKQRVVYIPTQDGYAVLLSVGEPEAFLNALRTITRG